MEIVSRKNTLLILAASVFVALFYMGNKLYRDRQIRMTSIEKEVMQIESQSESTEIEAIEKDLMETDLEGLDRELNSIEAELNSAY